jgi:uncharacterized membrane protein
VLRTLAWVLAAAVAVRLLLNPEVLSYPIGETPIFNWLLYGYGVPLAAFAAAAALASRQGRQEDEQLSAALQWGAIALALALLALEVRHYFHPLDLRRGSVRFVEWGALSVSWMLLGAALPRAARRWRLASLDLGGTIAVSLAGLVALIGQSLTGNPLFEHAWVGRTPILNHLLWVYGLPAAGLALAGAEAERRGVRGVPRAWRLETLLLVFLLVTLEVRQLFHGGYLDEGGTGAAERYAYSAAWMLLGTLLLLLGIARRGREVRLSALAVMLVAVLKVFLYDMAELRDLYRVFSLLGLGVSLLLLAWLYQRFVFRAEAA